jgi:hypothetical protein
MLLCGIWALNSWRQAATSVPGAAQGAAVKRRGRRSRRRPAPEGSLGERIDERWRRRQEGDY